MKLSPEKYHNFVFTISFIAAIICSSLFYFLKINMAYSLLVFILMNIFFYFRVSLMASARIKKMENVFPDVISLMASNLRSGITVDMAFLLSARPEFKPLDEEILKSLAKEEGVEGRVIFWGQIDHAIMPKYLKACDIFTRPSLSEGFGNSFVEAMAAELPVIATQEGGIADFLFDAKRNPEKETTGWAVDAENPEQIAEAVKDIISNPEKVGKVLATAKNMAIEKYDWNLIAKDMREKVFAKLFGTPTSK